MTPDLRPPQRAGEVQEGSEWDVHAHTRARVADPTGWIAAIVNSNTYK